VDDTDLAGCGHALALLARGWPSRPRSTPRAAPAGQDLVQLSPSWPGR